MVKSRYKPRDPEKKRELIRWRTDQILSAAMKIFAECGFENADVEDIAASAGVGKGTVYRYFKNKENLCLSVVEWGLNTLRERMLDATSRTTGSMQKLSAALSTYLGFFGEKRDFYRVLIEEMGRFRLAAGKQWKQRHLSYIHLMQNLLEGILKEGMREGIFKNVDPRSAAYALWGMSNSLLYKWLMSDERYPIKKELSTIQETYFSGILRKK